MSLGEKWKVGQIIEIEDGSIYLICAVGDGGVTAKTIVETGNWDDGTWKWGFRKLRELNARVIAEVVLPVEEVT